MINANPKILHRSQPVEEKEHSVRLHAESVLGKVRDFSPKTTKQFATRKKE